jgi:glycosyltransferase involved in cell wall biosynthesis
MRKSILLVLPSLSAGGTENYVLRFLRHVGNDNYCWHLLSPEKTRGDLHDSFEATRAIIHYQSIGYANPKKLFQLYNLIKNAQIQTICTFTGNFGGLALTVARIAGVKTRVGWYRSTEPAYKPSFVKTGYDKLVNRLLWTNATLVLSNSKAALSRNQTNSIQKCPTKIIDNGVDAGIFQTSQISKDQAKQILNIAPGRFTVCHVGRVDPAKNHETIFRVMLEMLARKANVVFVFCGKGTDSPKFLETLRKRGVSEIAIGLGLRKDLNHVYAASDLFYFPSITEGQPNALIEAMICDVPILASNIAPIKEVLPNELQDSLIDPYDWKLASERILAMARGEIVVPASFRSYAIDRFDPTKAFNSFIELL